LNKRVLKPKKVKENIISEKHKLFNEGFRVCYVCEKVMTFDKFENQNPKRPVKCMCKKCIYEKKYSSEKNKEYRKGEKYKQYQKEYSKNLEKKEILKNREKKYEDKLKLDKPIIKKIRTKEEIDLDKKLKLEIKEQRLRDKMIKSQEKINKKEEYNKLMEYYRSDEWKEIKRKRRREKEYVRWKRRWSEDDMFAVKVRLRNLIRNSFRRKGYKKFNESTEEIVGINYDEFKKYLESKFLDGMSWENRGDWHIDHIIPLCSANSCEELVKLCHYTNLQPLWAKDNILKGGDI
jgi:hypothetical protein